MTSTTPAWDRVLNNAQALAGWPVRAVLPSSADASFQRCLQRLHNAGAALQVQRGTAAQRGHAWLLLGAHAHTEPACAALYTFDNNMAAPAARWPSKPLLCLALSPRGGQHMEMNAWLEAAQAGSMPLWHQTIFTNDTIQAQAPAGPGAAALLRLSLGNNQATLNIAR